MTAKCIIPSRPCSSPDLVRSNNNNNISNNNKNEGKSGEGKNKEDDFVVTRCREILNYYEVESQRNYDDDQQFLTLSNNEKRWIVEKLTRDEQEVAAECSYAYWFLSTQQYNQNQHQHQHQSPNNNTTMFVPPITESIRCAAAMQEAGRHLAGADSKEEALKLLQATIQFHMTNKTTLYRTCMGMKKTTETSQENTSDNDDNDDTILLLSQQRKNNIHDEMNNYQTNVVRGHDKENRAILFAFPRRSSSSSNSNSNTAGGEEEERFVDSVMYILERSNACSEFKSIGKQDQIIGILDTKNSSCLSIKTIKNTLTILQKHYPGRLKNFIILNPPYIIRGIYKMIKPFLDPITAQKLIILNNNNTTNNDNTSITKRNKEQGEATITSTSTTEATMISNIIDDSQAMPVLLPGKGELTSDVNIDHFLYHVPFHQLYDYADDDYSNNNDDDNNMNEELKESLSSSSTTTITTDSSLSEDDTSNSKNIIGEKTTEIGHRDVMAGCGGTSSFKNIVTVRSLAIGRIIVNKNKSAGSSSSSVLMKIIHPTTTTAYTY
jgi:hypothetical protein